MRSRTAVWSARGIVAICVGLMLVTQALIAHRSQSESLRGAVGDDPLAEFARDATRERRDERERPLSAEERAVVADFRASVARRQAYIERQLSFGGYLERRVGMLGPWWGRWGVVFWGMELVLAIAAGVVGFGGRVGRAKASVADDMARVVASCDLTSGVPPSAADAPDDALAGGAAEGGAGRGGAVQ